MNIEYIEARIRNQLRIHWGWLKGESQEEVANFICAVMNGAYQASNSFPKSEHDAPKEKKQ